MVTHAQELVYNLSDLMPTQYQKDNLQAMLGLFLEAPGHPLPAHCQIKSASASRFLNINPWSTRKMIGLVRRHILKQVLSDCPKGRRPFLQVIIDLTTLEKCGKFKEFEHFATWLADLATIVKNKVKAKLPSSEVSFDKITCPTPVQQKALDLLGVSLLL